MPVVIIFPDERQDSASSWFLQAHRATPTPRSGLWCFDRQHKDESHTCGENTVIWGTTPSDGNQCVCSWNQRQGGDCFGNTTLCWGNTLLKTFIHSLLQVWEQLLSSGHSAKSLPKCNSSVAISQLPHLRAVVGICRIGRILLHMAIGYGCLSCGMKYWHNHLVKLSQLSLHFWHCL